MPNFIDVRRKAYVMQEINKEIKIPENAKEWELFTTDIGKGFKAADLVAQDLNYNLVNMIYSPKSTRESIWKEMNTIMENMAYYGAANTEPRAVLAQILDEIFGEE